MERWYGLSLEKYGPFAYNEGQMRPEGVHGRLFKKMAKEQRVLRGVVLRRLLFSYDGYIGSIFMMVQIGR